MNGTEIYVIERTCDNGLKVHCVELSKHELAVVPAVLIDHIGRKVYLSVSPSTGMIVVPVGDFGTQPYDIVREQEEGRQIYRQRPTLCELDFKRFYTEMKEQERAAGPGLVIAGAFGKVS